MGEYIYLSWNTSWQMWILAGKQGLQMSFFQQANINQAASGKREKINLFNDLRGSCDLQLLDSQMGLFMGFYAWARTGRPFIIGGHYNSGTVPTNKTLSGAAAAGQATIPISNTTGISTDDLYLIRTADRSDFELVKPSAVGGSSVTAGHNLVFSYAAADTFRDYKSMQTAILLETDFNPLERNVKSLKYTHSMRFAEIV